ncbi:hypothetical protein GCM10010495_28280 [Kitasatospora herbaricolor]|uniref:hypothetical protein n=1 Tax=Kitasatospora herbaricolor TaxID=68217 RepID=UPI001748E398|nr:hypothetical protein [Kitasatospora herbaricolor]MDQ0308497.1 hypothetical protein [Kitasatospora herbaricolor]GGV12980.1 hypothetical protein GCM10010495_28280 [Kitasatospora herbaricolor]
MNGREAATPVAPIALEPSGPEQPPRKVRQEPRGPAAAAPPRTAARRLPGAARRARLKEHEAALVGGYRELARLAYLVLPGGTDRHHRILAAHAVVQQALRAAPPDGPAADPSTGPYEGRAHETVRLQVLRGALARPLRRRLLPLPRLWGLRLFTAAGSPEDLALDQELARATPHARAGYALRVLEGLPSDRVVALLDLAGVPDPGRALAEAEAIHAGHRAAGRDLDRSPEFDPCAVRAQPTDLLRRRAKGRLLAAAAAAVLAAAVGLSPAQGPAPAPQAAADQAGRALPPPRRAAADDWRRTARLDFGVWPARGDLTADRALLGRAAAAWAGPSPQVRRTTEPGTPDGPPGAAQLLYAGRPDGTAVVVLYGEGRLARYTEGPQPELTLARADDADVTTAAALALTRTAEGARYLLAPWVDAADTRDLRTPDAAARPVPHPDGLTPPLALTGDGSCARRPVLQLRSSPVVAEQHAFLLADVGGLLPAHLTWTPPPDGSPARPPREATGPEALAAWARTSCGLPGAGPADAGPGTRALNTWAFATQQLPEGEGAATWVCVRRDRWDGGGSAATALLLPDPRRTSPAPLRTGGAPETRACSRFDQNVLAATWWRGKSGRSYLLMAGSRRLVSMSATGALTMPETKAPARALAVPGAGQGEVRLTGLLDTGARIGTLQ